MTDPFSLVIGVVSLIQAASSARHGIERIIGLKDAPERLRDLYNEVSELSTLASILQSTAPHSSIRDANAAKNLELLLRRAEMLITQTMDLIKQKLVKDPESLDDSSKKIEIRKTRWLIEEKTVNTKIARLSRVKESLQAALSTLPAVELPHMRVELQSINKKISEMHSSFVHVLETRLAEKRITSLPSEDGLSVATEGRQEHLQLISSSWQSSIASELPDEEDMIASSVGERVVVESVVIQAPQTSLCRCDCHSPLAMNTPQWLGSAIGTLLIRYTRDPRSCQNCATKDCRKGTQSILKTNYYFPQWLLRHAMCLHFNYTPRTGHTISLRMPRVVSATSPIFSFAQHNNIEGVRRLFKEGLASPFDVSYEEGRSALHYAVTAEKPEMVKFLLNEHADPESEDNNGLTANDVVWNYYLQNPGDAFFENFLTTIGLSHHDPDTLHKRKFSVVHQIVLGLSKVDLDEYLRTAGDEIDHPDLLGKTPLCWAASRPNPVFVGILLKHGASLHTSDRRKQTPLHYCAGSGHSYSMEIMLKTARERMDGKHQPINTFSNLINAKDSKGRTPLNFATRMNFSTHARLLIAAGADIESPDEPLRRTILLTAIYWNSHEVLPILLDSGAKTDQCDASHASILHYAARYANLKTLNVLLQHDLSNCEIDARDDGALTALETSESTQDRVEFEAEENQAVSAAALARILARCKGGSSGHVIGIVEGSDEVSESDVSESNDDFYDANSDIVEDIEEI